MRESQQIKLFESTPFTKTHCLISTGSLEIHHQLAEKGSLAPVYLARSLSL